MTNPLSTVISRSSPPEQTSAKKSVLPAPPPARQRRAGVDTLDVEPMHVDICRHLGGERLEGEQVVDEGRRRRLEGGLLGTRETLGDEDDVEVEAVDSTITDLGDSGDSHRSSSSVLASRGSGASLTRSFVCRASGDTSNCGIGPCGPASTTTWSAASSSGTTTVKTPFSNVGSGPGIVRKAFF